MAIINVSGGGSALQDAINSASSGDTLLVASGVYDANLTINKALTIVADGECEITNASGSYEPLAIPLPNNLVYSFDGFTISNCGAKSFGGIARNATLTNCKIVNCVGQSTGYVIRQGSCINCSFENINAANAGFVFAYGKVVNCVFTNIYNGGIGSGAAKIFNCTFSSSSVTSTTSNGYSVYNSIFNDCPNVETIPSVGFYNCCSNTTDLGDSNIYDNPKLTDDYHLQKGSPCIGAGNAEYLQSATDLDGKEWKTPPSIGCYEFYGSKQFLPSSLHPLGV
jgi:hypothetical protein